MCPSGPTPSRQHVEGGRRAVVLGPGGRGQLGDVAGGRGVDVVAVGPVGWGPSGAPAPGPAAPGRAAPRGPGSRCAPGRRRAGTARRPTRRPAGASPPRHGPATRPPHAIDACGRSTPPVSTSDASPRADCTSTSRVTSRAATAAASSSASRWTRTVGVLPLIRSALLLRGLARRDLGCGALRCARGGLAGDCAAFVLVAFFTAASPGLAPALAAAADRRSSGPASPGGRPLLGVPPDQGAHRRPVVQVLPRR